MLHSVRGKLIAAEPACAVVECGGVGFACQITANTARQLPSIGNEVFLLTHLNVREDAMELYGFADRAELTCFRRLISVSGVGAKVALSILSALTAEKVAFAVATGDHKAFTKANGVGPKLAQRVVLELRDKMRDMSDLLPADSAAAGGPSAAGNASAAVDALVQLGFSMGEAASAVGKLDSSLPVENLIQAALRSLARG